MNDVIFQRGTCKKGELYQRIIDLLVGTGWQHYKLSDGSDVVQSTGENGDKKICVQFLPYTSTANYSVFESDYCEFSYRLPTWYNPLKNEFERSSATWVLCTLFNQFNQTALSYLNINEPLVYYFHANKDRLLIAYEKALYSGGEISTLALGRMAVSYCNERANSDTIFLISTTRDGNSYVKFSHIADRPVELTPSQNSYSLTLTGVHTTQPTDSGVYVPMEYFITVGDKLRGKVADLYFIPYSSTSYLHGDYIIVGDQKYRIHINSTHSTYTFPTKTIVYRVE